MGVQMISLELVEEALSRICKRLDILESKVGILAAATLNIEPAKAIESARAVRERLGFSPSTQEMQEQMQEDNTHD